MSLTTEQYRSLIDVKRALVRRGFSQAAVGAAVLRAADRLSPGGMGSCGTDCCCCRGSGVGRIQMRSLRRDLDPSIKPRQTVSGEQCVRIAETDGDESSMYSRLSDYRNRGWTVMEIESGRGFPSGRVFWACPPGRTPLEAQNQILSAQLGDTAPAVAAPPAILAQISAAGSDPTVSAARDVVGKWSWLIPVGGLLMNLKSKIGSAISGKNDPSLSIARAGRSRR